MSHRERSQFATKEALAQKIRQLNLDIPLTDDVSILFEPIEIAEKRVPNRFAVQPMEGCDAEANGSPGALTFHRYRRYAAGGGELIWFEATAVAPEERASPAQLCISDANVGEYRRLVEQTRAAARESSGNSHDVLLLLRLTHAGRYSRPHGTRRPIVGHHSAVLDPPTGVAPDHPLISDEELDRLQEAFVHAAELAAAAGFDGVDVKACHGYLVSELLAAFTRENSRYGGSFENRTRFLLEVATRIRKSTPALFVTSRISAYDGIPHPYGFGVAGGAAAEENLTESQELVRRLRAVGCPLLNVSIGNPHYNPYLSRPYDKPTTRGDVPREHPPVGVARLLRITGGLQQTAPDLPIVGTGYSWLRQHLPNVGASIIKSGGAACLGLGRAALAYPDCIRDVPEQRALNPARICVTCSGCSQIMRDGGHVGCVTRDQEVYGRQYRRTKSQAQEIGRH